MLQDVVGDDQVEGVVSEGSDRSGATSQLDVRQSIAGEVYRRRTDVDAGCERDGATIARPAEETACPATGVQEPLLRTCQPLAKERRSDREHPRYHQCCSSLSKIRW